MNNNQKTIAELEKEIEVLRKRNAELEAAEQERELNLEAIRKAFNKLQNIELIINRSPAMTFLWPAQEGGPVELVSHNVEHILGYTAEELISGTVTWNSITHPEDIPRLDAEVEQFLSEGKEEWHQEYRLITKSGEVRWFKDLTLALRDKNGSLTYLQSIVIDITERKKAENSLRESEEQYRKTLDAMPDVIVVVNTDMEITLLNKTLMEKNKELGYDSDIIGRKLDDVYPFFSESDFNEYHQIFKTGVPVFKENRLTINNVEHTIDVRKIPYIENGIVKNITTIISDITEKKLIEEERAKASKIESIGILAGGIAHDFNNLLTGIIGNISLTKTGVPENSEEYEFLCEAEVGCVRATELTQQLLTFSKGGVPIKQTIDISILITETTSFSLRGSNVTYTTTICSDIWPVNVDKGQIHQALSNIIINAQQAMPKGGTVSIHANNTEVDETYGLPLENGRYITISIVDNGTGIPKENIQYIFDPYFTTKQKGSGLGLATTYSIIKRHGGFISVESDLGIGTTFTIYLPACNKEIDEKDGMQNASLPGEMNILVMDDESYVREVIRNMLYSLGNRVDVAADGAEAISMYKAALHDKPYDLVILDLTVPGGMGGTETMKQLTAIDKNVKVMISTGYSNDPTIGDHKAYGFAGYIPKPYVLDDLKEALSAAFQENDA